MSNLVEELIEAGKPITQKAIELDINSGNLDALYHATEKQIGNLIKDGKIDEDLSSTHQDYLEEMRCMTAELTDTFFS